MSNRAIIFLVVLAISTYEVQWIGAKDLLTNSLDKFPSSVSNKPLVGDSVEETDEEEDQPTEVDSEDESDDSPILEEEEEEDEPIEEVYDEELEDSPDLEAEVQEEELAERRSSWFTPVKIFLTEDVCSGTIARLPKKCGKKFILNSKSKNVKVGKSTGIVELSKSFPSPIVSPNILIVTKTGGGKNCKKVKFKLVIFIFPKYFGDSFLKANCPIRGAQSVLGSTKHGGQSSDALLRLNNHENEEATKEMTPAIKVEKSLECAIKNILKPRVQDGEKFFLAWKINTLFSKLAMTNLASRLQCQPRKVVNCARILRKFRTIDGTCNNDQNPFFGSAGSPLNRLISARYFDPENLNDPIGFPWHVNVPNMPATLKVVKQFILEQDEPSDTPSPHSHLLMQFGQFLDHDVGLSPESQCSDNCQGITIDTSVENFMAPCYSIQKFDNMEGIHFARSASECQIKNGRFVKREQINVDTSFVDASQVYGSDDALAKRLRRMRNKGLLKTSPGENGDFLPEDDSEEEGEGPATLCRKENGGRGCFLAGDGRSNEQPVLTSMHTLFVREHNRIARVLGRLNPRWDGERIYQETRKIVGAVLQKITYEDYLPIVIGDKLPQYGGYKSDVNPTLLNAFSTAAFRYGHTIIRPTFDVLDENFNPKQGMSPLPLGQLFFNTSFLRDNGIDGLLLGLLANSTENFDQKLATPLLKQLFERPGSPGLNLAALNIQRSRDHGLPGYNAYRCICGLKNAGNFEQTSKEITKKIRQKTLKSLYGKPKNADLWVAGLAEAPVKNGIVGATFKCIIREQFKRLRDGDSHFYLKEGQFTKPQLEQINRVTMSSILCDNLKEIKSVQENAFMAGGGKVYRKECGGIPRMDLKAWKETGKKKTKSYL